MSMQVSPFRHTSRSTPALPPSPTRFGSNNIALDCCDATDSFVDPVMTVVSTLMMLGLALAAWNYFAQPSKNIQPQTITRPAEAPASPPSITPSETP